MTPNITSIYVLYEPTAKDISACLEAVILGKVIIVDNTPPGSRVEYEKQLIREDVLYLPSSENLGYAAGANTGVTHAFDQGAEWVIVVNQDIRFGDKTWKDVARKITSMNPGVYGPFVGMMDPRRWTTILNSEARQESNLEYISGSFMVIHKQVKETIGLFHEPFFMYYEDTDYSHRAHAAGFPVSELTVPGILHKKASMNASKTWLHNYYLARNHMLFVERRAPVSVKLRELLRIPKTISEHVKTKDNGGYAGVKDYIFRKFGRHERSIWLSV